ncbi:transcription elongation factor TFIIS [Lithohypha guttulata]|uniref:Transcription elongation factor TFIIS n=1 Tax=Lithohypha guttulata TaxID=1690604 RepID=A0AAN7T254_9EURO|nr:transcription elongation factor TFIIS [Lithohypha guttulata]KAK5101158.1 transcription elongation factor TFIIS [Lithohypha guttulata]
MDEREVVSKANAINKALQAREPTANIVNLLRDLQKGVTPSEELLRKTGIGKSINRIKTAQGVDPSIPRLASEIVSQWRTQIQRNKGAGSGAATPTRPSDGQNGSASPAPPPSSKSTSEPQKKPASTTNDASHQQPTGVPLDKRTWKLDKLDRAKFSSETARSNSIGLLYDGLVPGSSLPAPQVLTIAKQIELSVLSLPDASATHTSPFYKEKIRTLYQNLKNPQNPELRSRILDGEVSPSKFASMTHEEMKSERQKAEDAKIVKDNLNNAMVAQEQKSVSNHLECGRCKQKKVSFTQAQTRSADEPMTTFWLVFLLLLVSFS